MTDVPPAESTPTIVDDEEEPARRVYSVELLLSGKPTPADYELAAKHREMLESSIRRPTFLAKRSTAAKPPEQAPSEGSTVDSWFDEDREDNDHEFRAPFIPRVMEHGKTEEEEKEEERKGKQKEGKSANPSLGTRSYWISMKFDEK